METNIDLSAYRVLVVGRVQGVGFRYFTSREANKLNILGHAKNLNNGDVEVQMYGEEAQLNLLLRWLEKGPETATVDHIEINKIEYMQKQGFQTL